MISLSSFELTQFLERWYTLCMNPLPAPQVPGDTPWERLDNAVRMVFKVPKSAFLKEEKRLRRLRDKKRAKTAS